MLVVESNPPNSHHHPLSSSSSSTFIPSSYSYLSSSLRPFSNTNQFSPFANKPQHNTTTGITKTRRWRLLSTAQVFSSLIDPLTSSSSSPLLSHLFQLAETTTGVTAGYSSVSYYTSLGLFVISVPGLWSLIKRSVKSKIVQKTYISGGNKTPNQVAGEIFSFFTRNNFIVLHRGETITFEGTMVPSRGQAALLTFCTCISLASVSLVLTITNPDLGNNWFWLTIFSPSAGLYYWKRASRKEQIKVKMIVAEDGNLSEIIVQGDDVKQWQHSQASASPPQKSLPGHHQSHPGPLTSLS